MTNNEIPTAEITAAIAGLTKAGRATMLAVGRGQLSYFDEGIIEGSGIWGECLTGEMGHKSSGVVNRLAKVGLWDVTIDRESQDGAWWSLTALGAAVANHLAAEADAADAAEAVAEIVADAKAGNIHPCTPDNPCEQHRPTYARPADAAANFLALAHATTGKARAFWFAKADAITAAA